MKLVPLLLSLLLPMVSLAQPSSQGSRLEDPEDDPPTEISPPPPTASPPPSEEALQPSAVAPLPPAEAPPASDAPSPGAAPTAPVPVPAAELQPPVAAPPAPAAEPAASPGLAPPALAQPAAPAPESSPSPQPPDSSVQPQPAAAAESTPSEKVPAPVGQKRRIRLAVVDFSTAGSARPELARALSDVAAAQATKIGAFQVISQNDISAMLGLERNKQLLACQESDCLTELAGSLNVDRLLTGEVTLIEHTTLLVLRVLDVRKAKALARLNLTVKDATESELFDGVRRLTHEALTGTPLDTTGAVRIAVSETGAKVLLDGAEIGRSPLAGARRVPEGPHTLTVLKDAFVTWTSKVTVVAGQELPIDVQLVTLKDPGAVRNLRVAGYVTAGAALVAMAAGTTLGFLARSSHQRYEDTTLRSEAIALRSRTSDLSRWANISFIAGGVLVLGSGATLISSVAIDGAAGESPTK